jgi:hypothetical protein
VHQNLFAINALDWCKNTFEVVNQLRINTKNSFHRYDVTLLLKIFQGLDDFVKGSELLEGKLINNAKN